MKRICVFCGSSEGARPEYAAVARALGAEMASRGIGLVFGGGRVGLMGAVASAVLENGGHVTGIIPHGLMVREVAHDGVEDMRVVDSMHERKALMNELSDAFISMPGGLGTIEETAEMLTWAQLGIHRKPVALLNGLGYYDPLVAFLDRTVEEGFLRAENRQLLVVGDEPASLLDRLTDYRAPETERWIRRSET
ncbi:MAG: TIGR00730 family Rossman fold protein [Blastocatellia bacterium]|nr:TIGR00730 family Rossman fold protein [Blastocatellia bacterium]